MSGIVGSVLGLVGPASVYCGQDGDFHLQLVATHTVIWGLCSWNVCSYEDDKQASNPQTSLFIWTHTCCLSFSLPFMTYGQASPQRMTCATTSRNAVHITCAPVLCSDSICLISWFSVRCVHLTDFCPCLCLWLVDHFPCSDLWLGAYSLCVHFEGLRPEPFYLLLLHCQLYLWGSPFFFFFCIASCISGVHHSSSSSALPAVSLGFTILGEIFVYVTIF